MAEKSDASQVGLPHSWLENVHPSKAVKRGAYAWKNDSPSGVTEGGAQSGEFGAQAGDFAFEGGDTLFDFR